MNLKAVPSGWTRALACLLSPLWALSAWGQAQAQSLGEPARVIVQFKAAAQAQSQSQAQGPSTSRVQPESQPRRASWLGQRRGLVLRDGRVIDAHRQVVLGDSGLDAQTLATRLSQDPAVAWAVPDRRRRAAAYPLTAPNDPLYASNPSNSVAAGQWYLRAPTSTFVSAINAQAAWAQSTGRDVVVADIDTGVLFGHPDLIGKLYAGYDFVSDAEHNRDGDGVDADASDPGDWSTAGECGSASASSWHGTQTSSVIGARTDNGVGMAGVAPDAMILPLRVLASCGGWDSDIIASMLWAAGLPTGVTLATNPHPARVLNLSLGSSDDPVCPESYQTVVNQIVATGVVIVASAGNDAGLRVETPGNCSGVITVGGLRHAGTKVGFSNVGPEIALSAPGGNCVNTSGPCLYTIMTATSSGTRGPGAYTYASTSDPAIGTSFSAPMVAGAAALMLARNPALTPPQVKSLLQSSARAFPTSAPGVSTCHAPDGFEQDECVCTTSTCGAGMLDVSAAVAAANPSAAPTVSVTPSATTGLSGGSITFNASASAAPTGRTLLSRSWSLASGSNLASFSGSTSGSSATLNLNAPGFVAVTHTLTDNLGVSASQTTWVSVGSASAVAASAQFANATVLSGDSVVASAAGSTGSGTLSHAWQVLQGASLVNVVGGSTGQTLTLQALPNVSGTVLVGLTVTDGAGQVGTRVASIQVLPSQPVVTVSASSTNVDLGQSISLDGSGSAAVTGRSLAGFQWSLASGSATASFDGGTAATSASLTPTALGTVSVLLTVTDNLGSTGSRQLDITVLSPTAMPTAVISSTASELGVGQVLVLDAKASVAQTGRPIVSYQWLVTAGSDKVAINGANNAATLSLTGLALGQAVVQLTVVDDHGKSSTQTRSLTVSKVQSQSIDITDGQSGGGGASGLGDLLGLVALMAGVAGARLSSRRGFAGGGRQR
jgi:serine protease